MPAYIVVITIIALVLTQLVSLAIIAVILLRVEKFLSKTLVYMKSNNIHDVLSAQTLIAPPEERKPQEDDYVSEDQRTDDLLRKAQQKHRNKHVKSLGADLLKDVDVDE